MNKDVAFACGDCHVVIKTIDGGKTWSGVTDFGGSVRQKCTMLSFIDENTGLIAGESKLAYTSDSGNTWTELAPPAKIMAIYLTSAKVGFLIGEDKKLYVTNDAGTTWTAQDLNIEGFDKVVTQPHTCAFGIADDGTGSLFYLKKGGILNCFETTDNGLSWTKSSELNVTDAVKNPFLVYLSHDAKCLSIQSLSDYTGAIVVNNE